MHRQRIQKTWGTRRTAAGPVFSSAARDPIIHGLAHRGANGAVMPTDSTATFPLNIPRWGANFPSKHAKHLLLLFKSNPLHCEGGGGAVCTLYGTIMRVLLAPNAQRPL